ncbi:hypothetical protein [Collimonas arenae]|uniref:hypothetical protein n=1 Tax=Collimonas arenae TaxID=279058 RepID=UPI00077821C4|nr:hypothetical protein [Collimonas arenae]
MPEIDLIVVAALLGYTMIVVYPIRPSFGAILAGFFIGIAILIKPHGIALLVATIVAIIFISYFKLVDGKWRTLKSVVFLLLSCYFTLICIWRLCSHEWSIDPSVALGLKFYGNYLKSPVPTITLSTKILIAIRYAVAHILVIGLVFCPVFVWMYSILEIKFKNVNRSYSVIFNAECVAAIFLLAMTLSHIAMVAWFTAGAVTVNAGEIGRLHGRYLGAAISFFHFCIFSE